MVNSKTDKELRDMLLINLASKVSPYKFHKIWNDILSFAKNRTEKKRAKDAVKKLIKNNSDTHPLIEELDNKILGIKKHQTDTLNNKV